MKTRAKTIIVCVGIIISGCIRLNAQVTIGCELIPVKGALLDLKTQSPDVDNVTSTGGGLLLPRVKLLTDHTFDPFTVTADPAIKRDHIGLTVYNLTDDGKTLHEGLYLWTGNEWKTLDYGKVVFLPAFRLDTTQGPTHTINLFADVYKLNFNPPANVTTYVSSSGVNARVAFPEFDDNATDFYYVVTDYDSVAFNISISPAGIMSYSVKTNVSPANAFVNAVMIRK
ncbi:MAG: hypothetical protein LBP72_03875 [Dysgonamonadaceae bacterium]|jgi:hypothetical protein|nr:hypothetical protein [Dysgonamonadaceae bacterium]